MRGKWLALLWVLLSTQIHAAEAPPPIPDPPLDADSLRQLTREAEAPRQVSREDRSPVRVRGLDPAVFTEFSLLTIPEVGVLLPADQRE